MAFLPVIPGVDYLSFQSDSFPTQGHPSKQRAFSALCGDNPPTIIDGYAKWAVVDRPLRQGLVIPQGYGPAKIQVEVRFGIWDGRFGFSGWDQSDAAADRCEVDIDSLHWMAGGNALAGASPVVYMKTFRSSSTTRSWLAPSQYRGVPWVIDGGVQWGKALRTPNYGKRVYQEASFTLLGYTTASQITPPPPAQTKTGGGFFRTTNQTRTAMSIAGSSSGRVPEAQVSSLARQITRAGQNNPVRGTRLFLERRAINWKMPVGIQVYVPSHQI